jgi:hypothetical protein
MPLRARCITVAVGLLATTAVDLAAADPDVVEEHSPLRESFASVGTGYMRDEEPGDRLEEKYVVLQLGQRLTKNLVLVEQGLFSWEEAKNVGPTMIRENRMVLTAGLRWTPFRPAPNLGTLWAPWRYYDPKAVYVRAGVGVDIRDRTTFAAMKTTTQLTGPVAELAIAWLPLQGRDYALGYEVRAAAARHDGDIHYDAGIAVVLLVSR